MNKHELPTKLVPLLHFEDTHVLVVSKPAGLLSQGEKTGDENLVSWARLHFGRHYVGLIHRLDRNTSGLMVLAKRSKSAQRLTDQLRLGKLCRRYHALLCGEFQGTHTWAHSLKKDPEKNRTRVLKTGSPNAFLLAKSLSVTHDALLGPLTLAEFELQTGRSHQIRAQAAHEGYPLLGDSKYGGKSFKRLALHSAYLKFEHPMTKEILEFSEPRTTKSFFT